MGAAIDLHGRWFVPLCLGGALAASGLCCDPAVPGSPPTAHPARDAVAGEAASQAGIDLADAARARAMYDAAADAPEPGRPDAPLAGGDATPGDDRAESEADAGEPALPPPAPGDLAIVELLVDPAGNDLGREWIEFANLAGRTLDLGGLHLSDGTSDVAVAAGRLAAGALLLLGQSLDPTKNGGAPVQVAYATRLQLNNGGDSVSACSGPCAEGAVLDAFTWDGSLGAAYAGHAIVVDRGARVICPAQEPFGDGGSFGSPGLPNPPCPGVDAGTAEAGPPDGGDP